MSKSTMDPANSMHLAITLANASKLDLCCAAVYCVAHINAN